MEKYDLADASPAPTIDMTPAADMADMADMAATTAVPELPALRPATFPYHPGDLILPGYRLTKRVGSGGFGEVWRAEAPGGMGVAIKILANLRRREGGREYRALQTIKNIRHAHIVPLFGVWLKASDGSVLNDNALREAEKRILAVGPAVAAHHAAAGEPADEALESLELIVAMGLGDQTLFDRLREAQREGQPGLTPQELLPWIQQAALALDHFNSRTRRSTENATAIQHCDIKPQNILLVGDVVQVCDFGLARAQGEVRATSNVMASLAYAAPEMVSPPNDPSPTTDQYSLAVSYIELRMGKLPYAELTPMTILRAKLDGRFDLTELAPAEAAVLQRSLAVDPAKRWPTCVDFVRALQSSVLRARDSLPVEVAQPIVPSTHADQPTASVSAARDSHRSKTNGILRSAAAAGGLAILAAAYAVFSPRTSRVPSPAPNDSPRSQAVSSLPTATVPLPLPLAPTLADAAMLERQGKFAAAAEIYSASLATRPDDLATVLWSLQTKAADANKAADCVTLLEQLERLYSTSPPPQVKGISRWDVVNSLAWYIATRLSDDADATVRAQRLAEEALTLAGEDPVMQTHSFDTLAAAAARGGDMDEALRLIDKAIDTSHDPAERGSFETRRDRYRQGLPWNEP